MRTVAAPPNAAEQVHALAELGHPSGDFLERLLVSLEWLEVPAGRRIFSEGEAGDGMYLLFAGRVRFVVESSPTALEAWELDAVGTFGEGASLTGGGRSRSAVVVRDALLARLPPAMFEEVLESSPKVAAAIARRVARRTVFPAADPRRSPRHAAAVAFVSPSVSTDRLAPLLGATGGALGPGGSAVAVGSDRAAEIFDVVRHSDRVFVVVDAASIGDLTPITDMIRNGIDPLAAPTLELVVLEHRTDRRELAGGVPARVFDRFLHRLRVREGDATDLQRLERHVAGRAVGLVLSGGGARGLAHIGVLRALEELGIPVDTVGGSSIGAIVGGQYAMGWTWEEVYEHNERVWNDRRLRWDVTLPTVSLFSGRRSSKVFDETFGTRAIEDFRLPFFCTSVDLSSFQLVVHRHGPAALWIRASASAPGLWPPVVDADGHLHIDGGQLNNVPTDLMRERHVGPIIAVDVFAKQAEMTLGPDANPPVGFRHLVARRSRPRYPSIADTFTRCSLLGSLQHQEAARHYADLYITPDVSSISFRGFDRIEAAVDIGYRAAMAALAGSTFGV